MIVNLFDSSKTTAWNLFVMVSIGVTARQIGLTRVEKLAKVIDLKSVS